MQLSLPVQLWVTLVLVLLGYSELHSQAMRNLDVAVRKIVNAGCGCLPGTFLYSLAYHPVRKGLWLTNLHSPHRPWCLGYVVLQRYNPKTVSLWPQPTHTKLFCPHFDVYLTHSGKFYWGSPAHFPVDQPRQLQKSGLEFVTPFLIFPLKKGPSYFLQSDIFMWMSNSEVTWVKFLCCCLLPPHCTKFFFPSVLQPQHLSSHVPDQKILEILAAFYFPS